MPVLLQPGMEVIGGRDALEAGGLGGADVTEQCARRMLLVGSVISDQCHGSRRSHFVRQRPDILPTAPASGLS